MAPPVAPPLDGNTDAGSISPQTPSPMVNGPANTDDEMKVWEHPWTVEEIKASAGNWSLAGDAGLLLHLQDFSQRILSKTHNIEKQVNNLVHEATMTGVRVNNVFNDFIMLANSQFVENRVYDEDISQKETPSQDKKSEEISKEQKDAKLLTMVVQAVNFGLDVIDQAFEKLDTNAGNSDSEDEESSYGVDPLFEAKDPYLHRQLPYLIGSANFMEDDNVGLLEIFSEEDEGETDHGSLSDDSEPEKGKLDQNQSEYTDEDFSSDSDDFLREKSSKSVLQTKYNNEEEEEEEESDGDLFGGKNSENEDENYYSEKSENETAKTEETDEECDEKGNTPEKPQSLTGFQAELAAKLGVPPVETSRPTTNEKNSKKTEKKESVSSVKSSKSKKKVEKSQNHNHSSKDSNLPFNAPEEEEDENSPFGRTGIFSNTKKHLFDDDDDDGEGGLFDDLPQKSAVKQPAPIKETISDNYDGLFAAPVENASRKISQESIKKPSRKNTLFDDDDDDDLFSYSAPVNKQVPAVTKSKPVVRLFDDDEDEEEDLFAQHSAKVEKRVEDDKSELSDGEKSLDGSIKSIKSSTSVSSVNKLLDANKSREGCSSSQSSNSLFADETDSDLFFTKPSAPVSRAKAKVAGLDLFDDEEEDGEEADPFRKTSKTGGSAVSEKNNREKKSLAVSGLFSEEEEEKEENNHSSSSSTKPKESVKKKPIGGVSLFGDVDIFSKKKKLPEKKEEAKKVESTKPTPRQSTLSLFDDDEDDEETDDLFSPLSKPAAGVTPTAPKPETKQRTKSLFEDEDVLFGAPEENPSVDLFSSEGPLASNKKMLPVTVPTKSKPTEPVTNLFDNTKKNSEPKKPEANEPAATNRSLNIEGVTESDSVDSDVAKETKPDAAPRPVKKPIGGVSLFGGADPFAEMMKKKKAAGSEKETDENENPAIKSALEKSGEISPTRSTTSKEPISTSAPPPPPPKSKKPLRIESEQHDSVNQLQIPRPQPPTSFGPEKLESPGVSFDQPPTPQPLQSATVTKERARILSRRRPQSRKARRAAAGGSEFDSTDFSPISPMTAVPYANEEGTFSPVNPIDAMSAPVLYTDKDPFNYKDLLNSKTKPSALSTPTQEANPAKTSAAPETKDSISKEVKTKRASSPSQGDDLFGSISKNMPSKKDDTEDLFGPSSVQSGTKKVKDATAKTKSEKVSIAKPELSQKDIRNNDNEEEDDDDDIFADTSIKVNKQTKDKKTEIKQDDGDDIFASSSISSKLSATDSKNGDLKQAMNKNKTTTTNNNNNNNTRNTISTTDDNLFEDDTDIFANLPSTKYKDKKTPTTTKSASKPLFKEDIDDIFADTVPSKKETSAKMDNGATKKSEKTPKKVASIFDDEDDDDVSLFDDPLSVKTK